MARRSDISFQTARPQAAGQSVVSWRGGRLAVKGVDRPCRRKVRRQGNRQGRRRHQRVGRQAPPNEKFVPTRRRDRRGREEKREAAVRRREDLEALERLKQHRDRLALSLPGRCEASNFGAHCAPAISFFSFKKFRDFRVWCNAPSRNDGSSGGQAVWIVMDITLERLTDKFRPLSTVAKAARQW